MKNGRTAEGSALRWHVRPSTPPRADRRSRSAGGNDTLLEAERPQDIDDILAIKDGFSRELAWRYVRDHTDRRGISSRLDLYFR